MCKQQKAEPVPIYHLLEKYKQNLCRWETICWSFHRQRGFYTNISVLNYESRRLTSARFKNERGCKTFTLRHEEYETSCSEMLQTWLETWQMSVFVPPSVVFLWRSLHVYGLQPPYVAHLRRFTVCWLEKNIILQGTGKLMADVCTWHFNLCLDFVFLHWPLAAVPAWNAAATCEARGSHLSFSVRLCVSVSATVWWCAVKSCILVEYFTFLLRMCVSLSAEQPLTQSFCALTPSGDHRWVQLDELFVLPGAFKARIPSPLSA